MRRLTQEEKNAFEKALTQTNGVNTHFFTIFMWSIYPRWRFWIFTDFLMDGMNWWSAYEKAKKVQNKNMKGCLDCKFYESSLYVESDFNPKTQVIRKCLLGNTQDMNNWWNENGNKVRNKDQFTELPCHENTEGVKLLQDLNGKLDELLKILNKK